ncbi:MAG TPA: alpha-amylase family glycosyl hydrolase [Bacteroidota bacterium]|nr:alpha-amylase family glycosyl hydrolase [Bacteroidota bacterium]
MTAGGNPRGVSGGGPPRFPDDLRTDAELGCTVRGRKTTFRLFAPRAASVTLVLFDRFEAERGEEVPMTPGAGGAWEHAAEGNFTGRWYGYRIDGPREPGGMSDPSVLVADPYSKAVTTVNHWRLPAKSLILDTSFHWGNDRSPLPRDARELVIYECHVRDMTAHPSARARRPGTYAGLSEKGIAGGLDHLLSLGVNAVELMPVMKFGTIELPYRDRSALSDSGRVNEWNPYARNHWGYMTSFFFAPESYYGTDGTMEPGAVNGADGRAVKELKEMVKALHREGIAVILDVVYNHTSHYDFNPFKYIDKRYYYRCDAGGNFLEASGCGNDFHTERPMARRVILDSVRCWLEEYRVDGFRFDLAGMIDEETCRQITRTARKIKPDAVLIAEPWGGGRRHPGWFADLGWWSWNDRYRDAIKGRDPQHGRGFIFGSAGAGGDPAGLLTGSLKSDEDPFPGGRPALNYVESHDGYTLGDFIRLATGEVAPEERFAAIEAGVFRGSPVRGAGTATGGDIRRLSPLRLALNKFGAMVLLTSPGPVMIHQGQEFARSKVIAGTEAPDPDVGKPDHNSYNKDNETNHLDYAVRDLNRELFDYYRGLVGLRKHHPLLCAPRKPGSVEFPEGGGLFAVCQIGPLPETEKGSGARARGGFNRYIVLLNASPDRTSAWQPPTGHWTVLADASAVHPPGIEPRAAASVEIRPSSGMILATYR